MSKCVFPSVSEVSVGFFKFMKNRDVSPRLGQQKSSMSQTLWLDRTRLIFYEKIWYFGRILCGKIGTDSVPLNKYFKNSSKMCPDNEFHGSDSDGISPLHPYYSRDYRSTSLLKASLAKVRCFFRGLGVCFRMFLRSRESFSNSWKIMMFNHIWVKKSLMSQTLWTDRTRLIFYEN